jgi:hypothetical protein
MTADRYADQLPTMCRPTVLCTPPITPPRSAHTADRSGWPRGSVWSTSHGPLSIPNTSWLTQRAASRCVMCVIGAQ